MSTTINTDADALATSLTTVQTAVAGFDKIAAGIAALERAHPVTLVADASTKDGMAILKAGYKAWSDPRKELERRRKEAKAPVIALGRNVDAFAAVLEKQLRAGEDNYYQQIEAYKVEQARIAEEAKKLDDARKEKHEKALAKIRSYAAMATGLPAARIANGIAAIEAMRFGAEWEEFASKAVIAQTETLVQLKQMLEQAKTAEAEAEALKIKNEAEAAAREQQRLENERVAAQLKAQRDALEAQAAALRRQEDEFNALREAVQQTEEEKPAPVAQEPAVPAEVAAARATLQAALGAPPPPAAGPVAQAELAAEHPPLGAAQRFAAIAAGSSARQQAHQGGPYEMLAAANDLAAERQHVPHQANEEPTVKLGEINAEMGEGFAMTEKFVTDVLKIVKPTPPAGSRGVLFRPSQVNEILEALAERALAARR